MKSFKEYLNEAPNWSPRPPMDDPAWPHMQPVYDNNNPDSGVDVWSDGTSVWAWNGTEWIKRKLPTKYRKKDPRPLLPWEIKPTRYA
jgi:hypothetical protein